MDGKTLSFGLTGKLWRNAFLMFDRETGSEWAHFTGECISGKYEGKTLEVFPAVPCISWKAWKERHPQTKVLSVGGRQEPDGDAYARYHRSKKTGILDLEHSDDRLPMKQRVIGVVVGEEQRAYPRSRFTTTPILNDEPGGVAIVVYQAVGGEGASVWLRTLGERTLVFAATKERFAARDEQTASTWDLLSGRAVAGELKGSALEAVPFLSTYWFSWRDYYPETSVAE